MRLAFILFRYFPYGGLQRDCLKVLRACIDRGARVTIYTMEWKGDLPKELDICVYPGKGYTAVSRRYDFVQFVQAETKKQEFTTLIGFNRMPGLNYYFAADTCFAEKALNQRSWWYRLTPRCRQYLDFEEAVFSASGKTRIFMVSGLQEQQYLKHYFNAARRMTLLPPGINKDRCAGGDAAKLRASFRNELGLSDHIQLLLQIGSGFKVKGVDRSLRAVASLPRNLRNNVRYVLIGDDNARSVVKLAQKLGIDRSIIILPGREDIPACLQGADILLHPAYSESAGHVLLESIVSGLPVITTDTCGFAEYVERSGCGRICHSPFVQETLNRLLAEMLESRQLYDWREAGIQFGRTENLYQMHERVAEILCNEEHSDQLFAD